MARWRLDEPHYINAIPPDLDAVEWEYKEIDRETGRERRRRYPVQMYCEKDTIVSHQDTARDKDFLYNGDPTPAMTPLDDEARAISDSFASKWIKPPDFVTGQNFSDALLDMLQKQFSNAAAQAQAPTEPLVASGVDRKEFEALKAQLEQLMIQNSELTEKAKAKSIGRKL